MPRADLPPPNGFSAEYKEQPITQEQTDSHDDSPTRLSVKTNIIYDLLLTPNIGIEVPIGRRVSVAADWVYAWWSSNSSHRCWRIYGGEIEGRYWLRSGEAQQRLTRHHIGVYAQAFTYDFAFGRHGRMGGKPGASMWQKAMLGAGVSYGYAVRMGKAMRMDFTIGIGYVTGDYHKYHYDNGCYVYDSTHRMNYFGPTRAEASLVWDLPLHRQKKGGAR